MPQEHPKYGLPMTAEQYAAEWQTSASGFASKNHYAWMCEQLGTASRVIEVGCGSGASTEALVAASRQVLVVESNRHCANLAIKRLQSAGIPVEEISLGQLGILGAWSETGVKLLVEDILSPSLEAQLPSGWFDAIVCWMTGTNPEHIGEAIGKPYLSFDGGEMLAYREMVHRRCFELGARVLIGQGIVHLVDRSMISSWSHKDQLRLDLGKFVGTLAGSRFSVAKGDCFLRKLEEGLNQSRIQYVSQAPAGVKGTFVLTSVKARLN